MIRTHLLGRWTGTILAVLLLNTALFAGTVTDSGADKIDTAMENLLNSYRGILQAEGWKTSVDHEVLTAYRFAGRTDTLTVTIRGRPAGNDITISVKLRYNGRSAGRDFRVQRERLKSENDLKLLVIPYLKSCMDRGEAPAVYRSYHASAAAGYGRFREGGPGVPEPYRGEVYLGFSLMYDPSSALMGEIPLGVGDYFDISVSAAIGKKLWDLSYRIDIMLYGTHASAEREGIIKRRVFGVYSGIDFFRPTGNLDSFNWSDEIYRDHPHIQYFVLRAVGFGLTLSRAGDVSYKFYCGAGLGPSVNSSLTATGITPEEENSLSEIFRSKGYGGERKDNFYYSGALPVMCSFMADYRGVWRLETRWNMYFFFPLEGEDAWDFVSILSVSPDYKIMKNLFLGAVWERWDIVSHLRTADRAHGWNRLLLRVQLQL